MIFLKHLKLSPDWWLYIQEEVQGNPELCVDHPAVCARLPSAQARPINAQKERGNQTAGRH